MSRRFNFTGRKALTREDVEIRLHDGHPSGPPSFTADFGGFGRLGLIPTARVIVEAIVRHSSMRFDFGTVGAIRRPDSTILDQLDEGPAPHFNVKIVDGVIHPGRLLALAKHIRPVNEDGDDGRKSILPLAETDLDQLIWRVRVGAHQPPILELNNRIRGLRQGLFENPVLAGAIFPMAVLQILQVVLDDETDTALEWVEDWRAFAASFTDHDLIGLEGDALDDVIEEVVRNFSRKHGWVEAATRHQSAEAEIYD